MFFDPVDEFIFALRSLNYEGLICVEQNDEISNTDIVFTHYVNFMSAASGDNDNRREVQYNRSKTGEFVWERYSVVDKTFSQVLATGLQWEMAYARKFGKGWANKRNLIQCISLN